MDKILVKIYFPTIDEKYDVLIPLNKKVYNIIYLLIKTIDNLKNIKEIPLLYNKYTGVCYDINLKIKDTDIRNGSELILI